MKNSSTFTTLPGLPSSTSSKSMEKRSWSVSTSLERLLQGRSPLGASQTSLPKLPELTVSKFPTFSEIVSASQDISPTRTPGLFEQLVGNPEVLLQAYLESPSDYDPELVPLVTSMMNGTQIQDLPLEDQMKLNRWTVTYAQHTSSSEPSTVSPPVESELEDPTELEMGEDPDRKFFASHRLTSPLESDELPWTGDSGGEISLENFKLPLLPEYPDGWWKP